MLVYLGKIAVQTLAQLLLIIPDYSLASAKSMKSHILQLIKLISLLKNKNIARILNWCFHYESAAPPEEGEDDDTNSNNDQNSDDK